MVNKKTLLLAALFLLVACPMFAQTPGGSGIAPGEVKFFGAMLGLGIAGGLCGIGQGKAVSGAAEAIARNPGAVAAIRGMLILGLVLIESLAIYTLVIVFVVGPIS